MTHDQMNERLYREGMRLAFYLQPFSVVERAAIVKIAFNGLKDVWFIRSRPLPVIRLAARASRKEPLDARYVDDVYALIQMAASMTGVTFEDVMGSSRKRPVCQARHLAQAAVRQVFAGRLSFPQIAALFRQQHHTTVMNAVRLCAGSDELRTLVCVFEERRAEHRKQLVFASDSRDKFPKLRPTKIAAVALGATNAPH